MNLPEGVLPSDLPPTPPGFDLDEPALAAQRTIGIARAAGRQRDGDGPDRGHFVEYPEFLAVQNEPMVVVTGQRLAIMEGFPDEKNTLPTILNMIKRETIIGRFSDTGRTFRTVSTGSRQESDNAGNRVFLGHTHVKAWMAKILGSSEEAEEYDPFNRDRAKLTVAVLGRGDQMAREAILGPFSDDPEEADAKREKLWQGRIHNGALYGADPAYASQTYRERDEYIMERYASGEFKLSDAAKYVATYLCVDIPVPRWMQLIQTNRLLDPLIPGIVSQPVREMYGIPYGPNEARKFRVARWLTAKVNEDLKNQRLFGEAGDLWLFDQAEAEETRRGSVYIPNPLEEAA